VNGSVYVNVDKLCQLPLSAGVFKTTTLLTLSLAVFMLLHLIFNGFLFLSYNFVFYWENQNRNNPLLHKIYQACER